VKINQSLPGFSLSQNNPMKVKFLIPLLLAASHGSGLAATGVLGSYGEIFTTTGVAHPVETFSSQTCFPGQNLATLKTYDVLDNEGGENNTKSNFTLIPEPASAFLGIIGVALLLLRRK
jgi:hypothetical protein